jgi:two-component system cell cycle sensor histidine kinase/response regulator CckA
MIVHMTTEMRILLIEDNPGDVRLLSEYLPRNLPYEIDITHCGHLGAALRLLRDRTPCDLILLDLFLPDSMGFPTFEQVRANARHIPIVVLSGWEDPDQVSQAIAGGARDYINKSNLDGLKLVRLLREAVRASGPHVSA